MGAAFFIQLFCDSDCLSARLYQLTFFSSFFTALLLVTMLP